jgi:hypothetical protein
MDAREAVPLAASDETTKRGCGRVWVIPCIFGVLISFYLAQVKQAPLPIARLV